MVTLKINKCRYWNRQIQSNPKFRGLRIDWKRVILVHWQELAKKRGNFGLILLYKTYTNSKWVRCGMFVRRNSEFSILRMISTFLQMPTKNIDPFIDLQEDRWGGWHTDARSWNHVGFVEGVTFTILRRCNSFNHYCFY